MRTKALRTLTIIGLTVSTGGWVAWAGSIHMHGAANSAETSSNSAHMTSGHPMMGGSHMSGDAMNGAMMDEGWGMTPEMREQGHMMMKAAIDKGDPGAILGLREDLGLTDDQVAQLVALQTSTQTQAKGILTDAQRQKLDAIPSHPESMAAMFSRMQSHMQGSKTVDASTSSNPCPVMQMMGTMMNNGDTPSPHHG